MEEIKIDITLYRCKICGHVYRDRELAERCEDYCSNHNEPDPDITMQGIPLDQNL